MIAQTTQPVIDGTGWTPGNIIAVIGALTALVVALPALFIAMKGMFEAKAANAKSDIANDRAGNNARAQTVTQDQVTRIAASLPPQPWISPPDGFSPNKRDGD